MSGVVYRPQGPHSCDLPGGIETIGEDYRKGTVWRCDCDTTWVSQGRTRDWYQREAQRVVAGVVEWKRESKRARRKRERNTPFAWPAGGTGRTLDSDESGAPPRAGDVDGADAGYVVNAEPPRGVTVTDRDGQPWIRLGTVWVRHDLHTAAASWGLLRSQNGPLRTLWSDGLPCPAPSPADPVE